MGVRFPRTPPHSTMCCCRLRAAHFTAKYDVKHHGEHMSDSEYEYQLKLYESMKDRVSFLQETKRGMTENLAKTTLTGSSAVLAFSLGFVKLSGENLVDIHWAAIAWGLFCLSIAAIIISYHYGTQSLTEQISVTIRHYNGENVSSNRHLDKLHSALLLFSSVSFLIGLLLLAVFTFKNI